MSSAIIKSDKNYKVRLCHPHLFLLYLLYLDKSAVFLQLQLGHGSIPYAQYIPTHVPWWIGAARFRIMLGPLTQNHFILQFTNKYHTIPSLIFCAPSLPIIFSEASPWSVSIRYMPGLILPGENRKTANTSSLSDSIFDTDYSIIYLMKIKQWCWLETQLVLIILCTLECFTFYENICHWFKTLLARISNFNQYKIIRGWHSLLKYVLMDTWPNPS